MGITPYINASIIMQLMTVVLPQLEELAKKGGEEGRKKISQYTRWLTIILAILQSTFMTNAMKASGVFYDTSIWYQLFAIIALVAGTLFLMWLGEQISDKGIGNGVSLIIFIGIVLRYPQYVQETARIGKLRWAVAAQPRAVHRDHDRHHHRHHLHVPRAAPRAGAAGAPRRRPQDVRRALDLHSAAPEQRRRDLDHLCDFDSVASAASAHVAAQQRRCEWYNVLTWPISHAIWQFPTNIAALQETIQVWFAPASTLYNIAYFLLVVIFTFFYSSIVLNTRDVADNLKKTGAFVPGIRPGQPTVDYLNKILIRLTTASAIFLGILAVAPNVLERGLNVTTIYLGSTSLLIVVGVALDTISQIEARLAMRDYRGFIKR